MSVRPRNGLRLSTPSIVPILRTDSSAVRDTPSLYDPDIGDATDVAPMLNAITKATMITDFIRTHSDAWQVAQPFPKRQESFGYKINVSRRRLALAILN